jgi:phosphatidylserine/phosphatidylglycerophosphate/cardiolipin synthase-like enzyme
MANWYDDDDDDSDDGYDAARDAYLTGEGPPVTRKQREEAEAWAEEERRQQRGW